jgi:hypothetical protein
LAASWPAAFGMWLVNWFGRAAAPATRLADDERAALVRLIHRAFDEKRYPLPPLLDPLKAIIAKLEPPTPRPEPRPPLRPKITLASPRAGLVNSPCLRAPEGEGPGA